MSDSTVTVAVRVRPLNRAEVAEGDAEAFEVHAGCEIVERGDAADDATHD